MGSRLVDADAVPDATDLQTNPPEIRRRVGVTPPEGFAQRGDLFAALEAVFPARFEPRASGSWRELDAVIALPGSVESLPDRLPTPQREPRRERSRETEPRCGSPSPIAWTGAFAVRC